MLSLVAVSRHSKKTCSRPKCSYRGETIRSCKNPNRVRWEGRARLEMSIFGGP